MLGFGCHRKILEGRDPGENQGELVAEAGEQAVDLGPVTHRDALVTQARLHEVGDGLVGLAGDLRLHARGGHDRGDDGPAAGDGPVGVG